MDRQTDDTFNRFDALGDMIQEEGIPVELSPEAKGQLEIQEGDIQREDQSLPTGDLQVGQLDIELPPPIQDVEVLSGSQVSKGSILVSSDPLLPKGTSDSAKSKKNPLVLGIQQKSFKKGSLDKPPKSGRKTDQERVKIMGENLVESGSVKPIDSHFSQSHK